MTQRETINSRFEVQKALGAGGMGEVLLVRDLLEEGKPLRALKMLSAVQDDSPVTEWFKREFHTLTTLHHPGLARVYDFDRDRATQRPFFTCDYIEGKDIFAATRDLPFENILNILTRIAQALDYIHSRGVLHNDLKTGNILVEEASQEPRILDFGLSYPQNRKLEKTLAKVGRASFHGTPSYAAPELIRGEAANFLTDLFALGMVYYKVLAGRLPHESKDKRAIFQQNLEGTFPSVRSLNAKIPAAVSDLVARLLTKDPALRPQSASEVVGLLALATGTTAAAPSDETVVAYAESSSLVGRERVLRQIHRYLRQGIPILLQSESTEIDEATVGEMTSWASESQSPGFAILCGPVGMGKTTLLRHLKHHCQMADVPFFFHEGSPATGVLQPWRKILAQVCGLLSDDAAVLEQHQNIFDQLNQETKRPNKRESAPDLDRTALIFGIGKILQDAFAKHPFILALDDVDTLDEVSVEIIHHLDRVRIQGGTAKIPPLVLTFRSLESSQAILKGPRHLYLALEPLTRHQCLTLLKKIFIGADIPDGFVQIMAERSGGNPFYLQHLVRELLASKAVVRRAGRWHLPQGPSKDFRLPPSLEELLQTRYRNLTPSQQAILSLAAVFEDTLQPDSLATLLHHPLDKLTPDLNVLVQEGILTTEGGIRFAQSSFIQAVHNALPKTRAVQLHKQCAEYLEKQKHRPADRLAMHWSRAGESAPAARWALTAAGEAQRLFAYQHAAQLYHLALDEMKRVPDAGDEDEKQALDPVRALGQLAEVYWRQGNRPKAIEVFEEVLRTGTPELHSEERLAAWRSLGVASRGRGKWEDAADYFEKGLSDLGKRGGEGKASLHAHLATTYQRLNKREAAEAESEKARGAIEGRTKPSPGMLPVLFTLAEFELARDQTRAARELQTKALAIAEDLHDARNTATALNNLGFLAGREGQAEEALPYLERSLAISRKIHDAIRMAHCLTFLGKVEYLEGNLRKAVTHLLEAQQLSRTMDELALLQGIQSTLGQIETERGNYALAARYLGEAEELCRSRKDSRGLALVRLGQAGLALALGRTQEGRDIIRKGLEQFKGADEIQSFRELACDAALRAGDYAAAKHLLETLQGDLTGSQSEARRLTFAYFRTQYLLGTGKVGEAHELLVQLKPSKKHPVTGWFHFQLQTLTLQVRLAHQKQSPEELSALRTQTQQLVKNLNAAEFPDLTWQAQGLLADILEREGQAKEAIEAAQKALDLLRSLSGDLNREDRESYWNDPRKKLIEQRLEKLSKTDEFRGEELKNAQQLIENLFRLLAINRELTAGWQNRTRLLEYILDTAIEIAQGQRAYVFLAEPEERWTIGAFRSKSKDPDGKAQEAYSQAIVQDTFRTGRPRLLVDAGKEESLARSKSVHRLELRSILSVPMRLSNRVMGILYIDFGRVLDSLAKPLIDVLSALADQAALSLLQAETHERLSQSLEDTTTELRKTQALVQQQAKTLEWKYSYAKIIGGKDASMRTVFELLDRIIPTHSAVLIQGESGTGKELVAQAIHYNGPRKDKPFVSINCAGLNPTLLESELFGHVKGSFTGAESNRDGLFLIANGGTVFLDEIYDMPLEVQAKLLRTLQEGEIRPLGSDKVFHVNVRIISASNQPLSEAVEMGKFRRDFFYRLNVVQVDLPPLRERHEDLELLIEAFLKELYKGKKGKPPALTNRARQALRAYRWPGNIRELYNTLESIVALHRDRSIDLEHLPQAIRESTLKDAEANLDLEAAREEFTKEYLRKVYARASGNVSEAARLAGVYRQSMYRMLERYGMIDKKKS